MTKIVDAALIDVVSAYCALNNVQCKDLVSLSFGEVLTRMKDVCEKHGAWVWASKEIRAVEPICHEECHINRIQHFMQQGEAKKDSTEPAVTATVIPFPTNTTKH